MQVNGFVKKDECNDKNCNVKITDKNGLGQGRQYSKNGDKPCENWPENQ